MDDKSQALGALLRACVLRAAARAVSEGIEPCPTVMRVEVDGLIWEMRLSTALPPVELRPIEEAILEVVSDVPQTSRQLARKAGYAFNSYFEGAVRQMVRDGKIRKTADGYLPL